MTTTATVQASPNVSSGDYTVNHSDDGNHPFSVQGGPTAANSEATGVTNAPEGDNLKGPSASSEPTRANLQKCVANSAPLNGVCVMLAKKIKKSEKQTAPESATESHDKSVQSSSAEERPFQKADEVYSRKPVGKETLKKGISGADEKFTNGLFDPQGRLLWQRVVIGGPGSPIVREHHYGQGGVFLKIDDKLHSSTSKEEKSKNSSSTCSSANCKSILKKSSGSDSENEGLKKDSEAVTSVPTKRSKKSVSIIAPASGEDQKEDIPGSGAAVKVGKAIPKSARDLITTLLNFVGELEDTTIKSNRMREKNVLNEYRGLVQLFLISQAGLMLAFALLTIFLVNVFALLFIVVIFVSR